MRVAFGRQMLADGAHAPGAIALDLPALGVDKVRAYNHTLAWTGAHRIASACDTRFDVPESMVATMATVMMPKALGVTNADAAAVLAHDGRPSSPQILTTS